MPPGGFGYSVPMTARGRQGHQHGCGGVPLTARGLASPRPTRFAAGGTTPRVAMATHRQQQKLQQQQLQLEQGAAVPSPPPPPPPRDDVSDVTTSSVATEGMDGGGGGVGGGGGGGGVGGGGGGGGGGVAAPAGSSSNDSGDGGGHSATVKGANLPRLSLAAMDKSKQAEERKNVRRATDAALGDLELAKGKLNQDGIDISLLTKAFQQIDDHGDGVLDLSEFRNLWKVVFPQRPLDEASWRYTERIFCEIDCDQSGEVSWDEILSYLNKSRRLVERSKPPTELRETTYRVVGNTEDLYNDAGSVQSYLVAGYKLLSQIIVIVSIVVLMVESLPSMQARDSDDPPGNSATFAIESVCIAVFTLEFLVWLWSFPESDMYTDTDGTKKIIQPFEEIYPMPDNIVKVKWRVVLKEPQLYVDVISILPYYVILIVGSSTTNASPLAAVRTLRLLRLLRILRILRLGKTGLHGKIPELGAALWKSVMSLIFLVFLIVIATVISSTFLFFAEIDQAHFSQASGKWIRDADSEYTDAGAVIRFQSIPASLWWGVVTLTTVGYGDFFPTTIQGKIIASLTMLCGLIVIGYPITILTGTFQLMEMERFEKGEKMDRCREFYNGMKEWAQTAASGGGLEKVGSFQSPGSPGGAGNTGIGPDRVSQQNLSLLQAIVALETKLSDSLNAIETRVRKMEKYDFATSAMLTPDFDSSDASSSGSDTDSVASCSPVLSTNDLQLQITRGGSSKQKDNDNHTPSRNAPFAAAVRGGEGADGSGVAEEAAGGGPPASPQAALKMSVPKLQIG